MKTQSLDQRSEITTAHVIIANVINKASLPHRDTVSTMMLLLTGMEPLSAGDFTI
ncbi:MAG: hypothetical protein ACLPV8_14365 [Steroidobacteraceae bacterium]